MPQVFGPAASTLFRAAIVVVVIAGAIAFVVGQAVVRAAGWSRVNLPVEQPVPFSHEHHVGTLGLDCRFCHTTVETSRFAGMPSTSTCLVCHSQVWTDATVLAPVRESDRTGRPIAWNRVDEVADFVFFDHRSHVRAGVACARCHGAVDRMPLTAQVHPLDMGFCLDCHRRPDRDRVPADRVFDPGVVGTRFALAAMPARTQDVAQLTTCSTCHR